jgi:hypothetical protein
VLVQPQQCKAQPKGAREISASKKSHSVTNGKINLSDIKIKLKCVVATNIEAVIYVTIKLSHCNMEVYLFNPFSSRFIYGILV